MTTSKPSFHGPLAGLRVVEFAGIGPGPFACMLLSDMGADVVTVDRPGSPVGDASQVVQRGRTVVQADLKREAAREEILAMLDRADVLVEGFRPGVMERLGLGPDVLAARNPRLVYARMTGWGQSGPLAQSAGHDINYIAITGALHAIGPADMPVPPLNLVGDYGGGSLYLVVGILAALHESRASGRGQVVDAAISDGVVNMMSSFVGRSLRGAFVELRASNMLDGGAPYYGAYATADGRHVGIGPIEPQFFREFCERVGLPAELRDAQHDTGRWPLLRTTLEGIFKSRTQADWNAALEGTDVCYAPVLPLSEAMEHKHNLARGAFVEVEGVRQPAPAPRFSRTASAVQGPPAKAVAACAEVIGRWTPAS
jgi:alpha-methylacyl-CoA racemase